MPTLPLFMFPTQVILIDDDLQTSRRLIPNLDKYASTYQFYDRPQLVLSLLNKEYKSDQIEKRLVTQPSEEEWQHTKLDVNLYDLMQEVYNPQRFDHTSTVVVDYDMPGMNGLEFCEKIQDSSIQKILLTGEGDEKLATQAFNQGLIHRYIKKQDLDIFPTLNQAIRQCQRTYFSHISHLMFRATTFDPNLTYILDPVFINFFENLLKEKNIVEYYLFEVTGSFLMLDRNANCYGLFTYNEEQLIMWEEMGEIDTAPEQLVNDLKNRKKMICFHDRHTIRIPEGYRWEKYAYSLQKLEGGAQTYFYACAQDMLDLEKERIVSFADYKNKFSRAVA